MRGLTWTDAVPIQEQLTAVRAFATQEAEGVETSALEALDALRAEYQTVEAGFAEEAEKLEEDLVVRSLSLSLALLVLPLVFAFSDGSSLVDFG